MMASDASKSAAPPPDGSTLARCVGLLVWASVLEIGDNASKVKAEAIAQEKSLEATDMTDSHFVVVSNRRSDAMGKQEDVACEAN
jgi:hypothetical protein